MNELIKKYREPVCVTAVVVSAACGLVVPNLLAVGLMALAIFVFTKQN